MMREAAVLLAHLLARLVALVGTRGTRAVLAENLLLKHQLLVLQRSRHRAPKLRPADRVLFGFFSRFLDTRRLLRTAIVLKPTTLLRFHRGLRDLKQVPVPLLLTPQTQARAQRARSGTDPSHL